MPCLRRFIAASFVAATMGACSGGHDRGDTRAAEVAHRLDTTAATNLAQNTTWPGIAAYAIVDDVALRWHAGLGYADTATRRPLTVDATFRIASVTKTFTAAAIFRLAEMNHLAVDDPIARYLQPATLDLLRAAGYDTEAITLDHLLSHTAGLPDFAMSPEYITAVLTDPTRRWSRNDQLALAMTLGAPLAAPGVQYVYSDTGYILLGEIVETKTGLALGAAYRALLKLDELGLKATWQESIDAVPAAAGERAHQYLQPEVDASLIDASADLWGGGGLVSTTHDLALFMRALLDGRVIGAAALERMKRVVDATAARAPARGLFRLRVRGDDCWGHDGFWGAVAIHCPRRGVTVAATIDMSPLGYMPGTEVDPFEVAARLAGAAIGS